MILVLFCLATRFRSASGSLDTQSLSRTKCGGVVAPRTLEEAAARVAFGASLGVSAESISVEASFFEVGGNSLRAVALARRLSDALGRPVSVADVLGDYDSDSVVHTVQRYVSEP